MATHNPTVGRPTTAQSRAPIAAAVAATALFAFLAFRLSFEALTALAAEHGVDADIAWNFAVLVDGGAVVGTVGVVAAKRTGRATAPYWWTVATFAGVSLAFNVVHSDGTGVGIAIAVVPPIAQLVATELLVRMLPTADTGTATAATVAPAVEQALDAARRAQAAATAAGTDAAAVRAALDDAATTVTDAAAAAQADTRDAIADAVDQAIEAATVATTAAGRAEQAATILDDDAAAPPLALVDLAAAVAAVDGPPAVEDSVDDARPPLPHTATFTAPPLPTPTPLDDDPPTDAPTSTTGAAPADAVAAYRRLRKSTGKRPTAEALGAALGVKRTRGGELRRAVEQALGIHIAAVIKS
ncbi:DUF2637 domain-containing protein [Streptomyces sp. SRF1]|uniref:DUF2637 domain-containing protein n=1 Tax=Streptomyces sp. SRF1 TaxID=1549642 RepID=UPI0025B25397|nr:DUF2637 domain-containing protein [Streptomyces sp. SRF1]MDN3056193.1 DUF2637 domain-containing protein [Streptomyces sp. SRF1]